MGNMLPASNGLSTPDVINLQYWKESVFTGMDAVSGLLRSYATFTGKQLTINSKENTAFI